VDTGLPNRIVAEALRADRLPGLPGLEVVATERKYGAEGSRVDVLARDGDGRSVYVEVKNTTLRDGSVACFPDAVTTRGAKHLRELQAMVALGHRAALVFLVNRGDVETFDAAREVDPAYALALGQAARAGVEILPVQVRLEAWCGDDGLWSLSIDPWRLLPRLTRT
jgi:sugar fermentation stimulation protein A